MARPSMLSSLGRSICANGVILLQVPVEPYDGAGPPRPPRLAPDLGVAAQDLGVAVTAPMVEVHYMGAVPHLPALYAEVLQPLAEFAVEAAIAHPLLVAVDGDDVASPGRGVVTVPGRAGRGQGVEEASRAGAEGEAGQAPGVGRAQL